MKNKYSEIANFPLGSISPNYKTKKVSLCHQYDYKMCKYFGTNIFVNWKFINGI